MAAIDRSIETPDLSFLQRHHFLLRRLHSLSGIVPVGLFVIMHLFTNFQLITGTFQHEVEWIHSLPALLFLEVSIWVGIGFHAALGIVYTFTGRSNVHHYGYADNWRYTLQRVTGILALVFILLHVATLRWGITFGGRLLPFFVEGPEGQPLATASTARALQDGGPVLVGVYVVGVLSVIFHWCNGLWTAAITWGLTISPTAMRRWGYVCATLGVFLTVFGLGAIVGAVTYDVGPGEDRALKEAMQGTEARPQAFHVD